LLPPKVWAAGKLSENLLVRKISSTWGRIMLKTLILENVWTRFKCSASIINHLCQKFTAACCLLKFCPKFAVSVRKSQPPAPPTFFDPWDASAYYEIIRNEQTKVKTHITNRTRQREQGQCLRRRGAVVDAVAPTHGVVCSPSRTQRTSTRTETVRIGRTRRSERPHSGRTTRSSPCPVQSSPVSLLSLSQQYTVFS